MTILFIIIILLFIISFIIIILFITIILFVTGVIYNPAVRFCLHACLSFLWSLHHTGIRQEEVRREAL